MEERRKLERRHIMFYSRVFDRKTGQLLGYLGNITSEGIMLISETPMDVDVGIFLRIDLPDDMYAKPVLNLKAKSVWCKPDIDPKFYTTGFQLSEITEDDLKIIDQIIDDYGFRN
jgi:hypothetical protein